MSTSGLLLLSAVLAAPPAVGLPRLDRGAELVYRGEVVEGSDRWDNRFRKRSDLETRVFVLEAGPASADCAVMTLVRPQTDAVIAAAADFVTGSNPNRNPLPAAVRIDFIRVDARGRCKRLRPPAGPPPIPLGPDTPTISPPSIPFDGPPLLELGMFVPLPVGPVSVGDTWDEIDPGRPPVVWTAGKDAVWNGSRCVELIATQQTDGWDRPTVVRSGWKRTDTILAPPSDGFAATVRRRVERREGTEVVGWVEVNYQTTPPNRLVGVRYADQRYEAEAAFGFATDTDAMLTRGGKPDQRTLQAKLAKIKRFLAENPNPTAFREATEAARRRCEAATQNDAPPAVVIPASVQVKAVPVDVGKPAPDFAAPRIGEPGTVRLSAGRGKPVVIVFFKPTSNTARATLTVAEALHKKFADRATVIAVVVAGVPEAADALRKDMTLTVPVADGAGVRDRYGIDSYPRFFVVDPVGDVTWRFDGFGMETGYLAKQEVERQLSVDASPKHR